MFILFDGVCQAPVRVGCMCCGTFKNLEFRMKNKSIRTSRNISRVSVGIQYKDHDSWPIDD